MCTVGTRVIIIGVSCSSRMQVSQLCVSQVVSEGFEDFLAKLFDEQRVKIIRSIYGGNGRE